MPSFERRIANECKTDTLNVRIAPATKMALKGVVELENRSMANALEYLVSDYHKRHDNELPKATTKGDARCLRRKLKVRVVV
jgi:iron-sulfur cluster repair protein YtfE (RIC family)